MNGSANSSITVGLYQGWMAGQVIDMIATQYGKDREAISHWFETFYEAPFQREHSIRLVALDGKRVCGFQSFFYWPYEYQGERLRSFQSGNSIVAPDYRGQGVFARLLSFLDESDEVPQIDFLLGFPVPKSYGSLIRNGWINPLDLSWYVRPIRPLSVVTNHSPHKADWRFDSDPEKISPLYPADQIALSKQEDFVDWRTNSTKERASYSFFHHRQGGGTIRFEMKPRRRGRINELVIGDIVCNSADRALLSGGLKSLIANSKQHSFLTMLSIALNVNSSDTRLLSSLRQQGFFKITKRIHFNVKPLVDRPYLLDPSRWQIFRSDIDTW